jgi:hypothetical protein
MTETRQALGADGKLFTKEIKLQAMLYGAATGIAPPGPQTEYILVSAYDDGAQAWVEIHAGIDIAADTITLPATPL